MKETFPIEQVAKLFTFCIALIFSQTVLGQTQCKFKVNGALTPKYAIHAPAPAAAPIISASGSFQALEGCVLPISTRVYPSFYERGGGFSSTYTTSNSGSFDASWYASLGGLPIEAVDACGAKAAISFYYCHVYYPGCQNVYNDAVSQGTDNGRSINQVCCDGIISTIVDTLNGPVNTGQSDLGVFYKLEDVLDVEFSFENNYKEARLARDNVQVALPFSPFDNIQFAVTVRKLCPSKPAPNYMPFGGQLVGTGSDGVQHIFDLASGLYLDPTTKDSSTPRYLGRIYGESYSIAQSMERLDELLDLIGQQGGIGFRLVEYKPHFLYKGPEPYRTKDFGQLPLSACHQISGSYPERDIQGKIVPLVSLRSSATKAKIPAMELYNLAWGQRYDTGSINQIFPYRKYGKQLPVFVDFYPVNGISPDSGMNGVKSTCDNKLNGSPIFIQYLRDSSKRAMIRGRAGITTGVIHMIAGPNGNLIGADADKARSDFPDSNVFSHELGHVLGKLHDEYSLANYFPKYRTNGVEKPFAESPTGYVRSKRLYARRVFQREYNNVPYYIPNFPNESIMGSGANMFNVPSCAHIMSTMEGRPAPEFLETCANNGALRPDCVATGCPDKFICDQETRYCMAK